MKIKVNHLTNMRSRLVLLALLLVFGGSFALTPLVQADQYDEQIKALQAQNSQNHDAVNSLAAQASSYQDAIDRLQAQINSLQAAISANQARQADLQKQIVDAQAELDKQRQVLGESIRSMYVEGQISTLEMLASSKDLSEFVDKQEYRNSVQNKIKVTLDKVTALKQQLQEQKQQVENLLVDQQKQQSEVAAAQGKQAQLLTYNQDQQSQFSQQIKQNNANISEIRRQQLIANARFIGGSPGSGPACGGGYPAKWCERGQDTVLDDWGMYNRECVSYTAFKVAASGRYMPYWGGYGNANQWDDNARAAHIPVDGNPQEGDVAQTDAGGLGHVMYVEHVYGDGTIYISQYNAGLDGRYSEKRISAAGLNFIHF